ncbi:hypothetical protein [Streptomyces prasinus]
MKNDEEPRARLVERLTAGGSLRTGPWREAVSAVPRHAFLRGGFFREVDGSTPTAWTPVMPDDPRWPAACYDDVSLVTQIAGTVVPGDLRGEIMRAPTSSSTLPGLVVRMLEDLRVESGHRVLEIGTGTGYSTALLCHRLGDDAVTSAEIDEDVSTRAPPPRSAPPAPWGGALRSGENPKTDHPITQPLDDCLHNPAVPAVAPGPRRFGPSA